MAYDIADYDVGKEVSSTGEGRHLSFLESALTHPTHTDGLVDGGDPVLATKNIVGIAFTSAAAATDLIAIDSEGIWCLNVVASDGVGTSAIVVGDAIYISATAVLSKDPNGTFFGWALTASGASATAAEVIVKVHAMNNYGGEFLKGSRFLVTMPSFAAADVAKGIWIAPAACKLIEGLEAHGTVAGQAGTLNIEKCNTAEAAAGGNNILATGWDLESTINTPVTLAAIATGEEELVDGDELRLVLTAGAATSLADAVVTLVLEWL